MYCIINRMPSFLTYIKLSVQSFLHSSYPPNLSSFVNFRQKKKLLEYSIVIWTFQNMKSIQWTIVNGNSNNFVEWHTSFTSIDDDMYQFSSNHMSHVYSRRNGRANVFDVDVFPYLFLGSSEFQTELMMMLQCVKSILSSLSIVKAWKDTV